MKRKTIYVLVVLMSLGMIGIISIQYFWIRNAIDLRRVEFKRSVMTAMNEVTQKLHKEKTYRRIEKLNQLDAIIEVDTIGNIHFTYGEETSDFVFIQGVDSTIEIHDKNLNKQLIKQEQILQLENLETSVWTKSTINELNDSLSVQIKISKEGIEDKVIIYEQLLKEINEIELFAPIEQQIDKDMLQESLREAFSSRGLSFEFYFGVLSYRNVEESEFFDIENEELILLIQDSPFKVNMFPGDSFNQNYYLSVVFPNIRTDVFHPLGVMLGVSALFILIVIAVFIITIRTIFKQKKLSEIKNDFISNMTHELKTPISTISLACEALEDKSIVISEDKQDAYINIIHAENSRLGVLVEKVLRNSILDKGEVNLKIERIDLNEFIKKLDQFDLHIKKNGGEMKKEYSSKSPIVSTDPVHLLNVISNLVDNAIKYSTESPSIIIRIKSDDKWAILEVEDNGRGISKDHLQKIFDKFFRVPTGNVHNVKGFGLGLSYVWDIVNRMGGSIEVKSEINKGSKFTLKLPLSYE